MRMIYNFRMLISVWQNSLVACFALFVEQMVMNSVSDIMDAANDDVKDADGDNTAKADDHRFLRVVFQSRIG